MRSFVNLLYHECERDSIWKSALDFVDRINATGEAKIQNGEKEEDSKTGSDDLVVSIAEKIMQNYTFATMNDTGEIYHYDIHKGMHVPGGKVLIETEAEEFENRISTCKVNEIVSKIKRRTYVSPTEFDKDSNLLILRNGLFNIMTGEFYLTYS